MASKVTAISCVRLQFDQNNRILVMASAVTKKRERVYPACRAIFSGSKALIRKKKLVVQEIRDHGAALASLSDIGYKEIIVIVRDLLEKQVFESDLKARLQFPKLFQSSAERDALREASELDAAQSVADILEELATDGEDIDDVEVELESPLPSGSKGKEKSEFSVKYWFLYIWGHRIYSIYFKAVTNQ